MNHKVIAADYYYYLSIAVRIFGTGFMIFLIPKALAASEVGIALVLVVFAGVLLYWSFFVMRRFIYAKIDLESGILFYGNLFFNKEVKLTDVEPIGKYLYFDSVIKIRIGERDYYMGCLEDEANYFRQLWTREKQRSLTDH